MSDVAFVSELTPGTYMCLRTESLLGAVVRAGTHSPYDHAVLVSAPGRCIQATVRGVTEGPLTAFTGCMAVANAAEAAAMTSHVREVIVAEARSMVGDEYDFPLLATLGLRLAGFRWQWLLNETSRKGAVICSELVAMAGQAGYQDWTCGTGNPALVTPAMLAARPGLESVAWDAVLV
jgi:hypothetical protein